MENNNEIIEEVKTEEVVIKKSRKKEIICIIVMSLIAIIGGLIYFIEFREDKKEVKEDKKITKVEREDKESIITVYYDEDNNTLCLEKSDSCNVKATDLKKEYENFEVLAIKNKGLFYIDGDYYCYYDYDNDETIILTKDEVEVFDDGSVVFIDYFDKDGMNLINKSFIYNANNKQIMYDEHKMSGIRYLYDNNYVAIKDYYELCVYSDEFEECDLSYLVSSNEEKVYIKEQCGLTCSFSYIDNETGKFYSLRENAGGYRYLTNMYDETFNSILNGEKYKDFYYNDNMYLYNSKGYKVYHQGKVIETKSYKNLLDIDSNNDGLWITYVDNGMVKLSTPKEKIVDVIKYDNNKYYFDDALTSYFNSEENYYLCEKCNETGFYLVFIYTNNEEHHGDFYYYDEDNDSFVIYEDLEVPGHD